jgi:hypothetical protein
MTKLDPELLPQRPPCSKCQGRMALARIEPVSTGIDMRTFECPKCGEVLKVLVEYPLKSDKGYWQNNEPRPQE